MQIKEKGDDASKEARAAYDDAYKVLSDEKTRAAYDKDPKSHKASNLKSFLLAKPGRQS